MPRGEMQKTQTFLGGKWERQIDSFNRLFKTFPRKHKIYGIQKWKNPPLTEQEHRQPSQKYWLRHIILKRWVGLRQIRGGRKVSGRGTAYAKGWKYSRGHVGTEQYMDPCRKQKIVLYSSAVLQDHRVQMRGLRGSEKAERGQLCKAPLCYRTLIYEEVTRNH